MNLIFIQEYVDAGSIKKSQMKFQNVTNAPLLTTEPHQKILGALAIPELHLLIGWLFSFEYSNILKTLLI
jgi:hypothetical protein